MRNRLAPSAFGVSRLSAPVAVSLLATGSGLVIDSAGSIIVESVPVWGGFVMRRVGRCCLAVLIASLGWFACGASARAAASGAPQTFEESQCTEFSPGYVYCYGSKFFVHQAVAPSGNVALQVRYVEWQSTLFDGTYVYNEAT